MGHLHIYSFCGQPGCKDAPWHSNTEDLVSPVLNHDQVAEYFKDKADFGDPDPDTYVVQPCEEANCPNPDPVWLYVRRDDPLTLAIRPNHYDPAFVRDDENWAHC